MVEAVALFPVIESWPFTVVVIGEVIFVFRPPVELVIFTVKEQLDAAETTPFSEIDELPGIATAPPQVVTCPDGIATIRPEGS